MGKKDFVAIQPRRVAVCIAYVPGSTSSSASPRPLICLVSSRKHDGLWVLPKGGIEKTDGDERAAAVRELWEEAGVRPLEDASAGSTTGAGTAATLTEVMDVKAHKKSPAKDASSPAFVPRAIYTAVEVAVAPEDTHPQEWPESGERQRCFVEFEEALKRIEWRKDIWTLLQNSSLAKS